MSAAAQFVTLLEQNRFDFFSGVPCSLLTGLIQGVSSHPRLTYVPAVREDAAVGIATGASLAGRRAAVLMQNSGLGTALNALASLNILYKIPLLLLVSWRGYQGQDAPEHLLMGEVCTSILDTVKIPYRVPEVTTLERDLAWARETLEATQVPAALFIRKGIGE